MNKEQKLEIKRHSLAHVLAAAVLEMFPEAKFGVGPNIENGFYYDFDLPRTLIPEDLPILEKKMREIIKKNFPFMDDESIISAYDNYLKGITNDWSFFWRICCLYEWKKLWIDRNGVNGN